MNHGQTYRPAPLCGLLLAGGKSTRMGRDKASITIGGHGLTQARHALELLGPCCERTYISLREGQSAPQGGEGVPVLRDSDEAEGPLCGMLAAFREAPAAAWLVMACDLPFVTPKVLARLVECHREQPGQPFVAYANSHDGLPEPLCAIYGPAALPILQKHAARGNFSPRRIMTEENTLLLDLPAGSAISLININTPQDVAALDPAGC
jgi:molybdopterin-guanine dinucleotide biosynthesis protein A